MNEIQRRDFIRTTARAGIGLVTTGYLSGARPARAAKPDRRVKVGQIGTGHAHAGGKMVSMRKLADQFEVVGVVEPDADRRKAAENKSTYQGLKWMTEEELLNTKGLQAVAVETVVADLVPTAARCVAAGMHLHLDKPAGDSLSAFKQVLDDATRQGLTIQMGYMFRNNPAFEFCFQAVRDGWLGEIFEVHGVISKTVSPETRQRLTELAGGAMYELGCHLLDAMVVVLGKPDKVTGYSRHSRPELDDLADNELAVCEYPKATATIRSAFLEVEGPRRRQFVVCGDQGTVDIRPIRNPRLLLALDRERGKFKPGYQEVKLRPSPGSFDDQLTELAQIVRGEQQSPYPPSHDLAVHETILRASGLPLK